MRLDKPIGIWLLLWPCWWAVALASGGLPSAKIMLLFALGAALMRPAGCIVNDMADRRLDAKVARTRTRPLASGELSLFQAGTLLAMLLAMALAVAWALGEIVILWAAAALPLVMLYPWMKRITWWPQLFLGLTFNWGALMGWVAVRGQVEWPAIALYIGGVFWTLGYDTIYAHQDKADDARAGVKSLALRLGAKSRPAIAVFYGLALVFWAASIPLAGKELGLALLPLAGAAMHLAWQLKAHFDTPAECHRAFVSNALLGWWVLAAILIA